MFDAGNSCIFDQLVQLVRKTLTRKHDSYSANKTLCVNAIYLSCGRKIPSPTARASQRSRSKAFGGRHLSCQCGGMSHALTSDLGCYKVHYVTQKYSQCFANPPRSFKKPGEITLDSQGCIPRWKPLHHPGMEPKPCRGRPLMSGFF